MIVHAIILMAIVNAEPSTINNEIIILNSNQLCDWIHNCSAQGYCSNSHPSTCICWDKYATYNAPSYVYCNYERKNWGLAFSLTSFLGMFGVNDFYLENYKFIYPKLILWIVRLMILIVKLIILISRSFIIPCINLFIKSFKKGQQKIEDCSICLSNYIDNDVIKTLPCNHSFHMQCITPWLNINNICPLCRAVNLYNYDPHSHEILILKINAYNSEVDIIISKMIWIWYFIDLVGYGTNIFNDGNSIALADWLKS